MDDTDRALIALLQKDARKPVSALAAELRISRSTVQARMDRLLASGRIRRFTVDLDRSGQSDRIEAVMLIELTGAMSRGVIRALNRLPEITALHSTNGSWDLVARIETASLPAFDKVLREVRMIPGVVNSQTCLLLDVARA